MNKKAILIGVLLITIFFAFGLRDLQIKLDLGDIIVNKHSVKLRESFEKLSSQNASQLIIVHDAALFSLNKMHHLKEIQALLESNPNVDSVYSLFTLPNIVEYFYHDQSLPLLSGNEHSLAELEQKKEVSLNNRAFVSRFISSEGTTVAFIVTLKEMPKAQAIKMWGEFEDIVNHYHADFQDIFQTGPLEGDYYEHYYAVHDSLFFGVLIVVIFILVFSFLYKSVVMSIFPLVTSFISIFWTLGALGYLGVPINVLFPVAVTLLFTMGAAESVHLINTYLNRCRLHPDESEKPKMVAILRYVFWPIFFTTVTTIMGFLSNFFSSVMALKYFSVAECLGILFNMILILGLLPVLLTVFRVEKRVNPVCFTGITRAVIFLRSKLMRMPVFVMLGIAGILAGAVYTAPKIPVEILQYINYYEHSPMMSKIKRTETYLSGTRMLTIYLKAEGPHSFKDERVLVPLLEFEKAISAVPGTSSSFSIASVIASSYQVILNGTDTPELYKIPKYPKVTQSFFELFEQPFFKSFSNGLLTPDDKTAKITIMYQLKTTPEMKQYSQALNSLLERYFPAPDFTYEAYDPSLLNAAAIERVLSLQLISIGIIYFAIFILMVVLFKSLKAGAISLIPNLVPIAGMLVFMFLAHIPFCLFTVIVFAVVLGLAVDDTVHIMYSYKYYLLAESDAEKAMPKTLASQIPPVTTTSIVLWLGGAVLLFSALKSIMFFALLMVLGISLAWLTEVMLTPLLLGYIMFKPTKASDTLPKCDA